MSRQLRPAGGLVAGWVRLVGVSGRPKVSGGERDIVLTGAIGCQFDQRGQRAGVVVFAERFVVKFYVRGDQLPLEQARVNAVARFGLVQMRCNAR